MEYIPTTVTSSSISPSSFSIHPDADLRREAGDYRSYAMSISRTLKEYLDREHVHYDVLQHPEAFRALAIAHVLHTPEKEMAKVVIVKIENRFVMTVLPASWQVDLHRLRNVFMTNHVRLATEEELKDLFPDCELGAMPPFGILYGVPVYVDHSLTEDGEIVFQAGTHSEAIRMRYVDFAALVFPVVEEFHRSPSEVW
jgi:Ala-tRNA(Pro) deacylase